jgi:hypothetical protein
MFVCCVVLCRYRSLRRSDYSSRGILLCARALVSERDQETPKREAKGSQIKKIRVVMMKYQQRYSKAAQTTFVSL